MLLLCQIIRILSRRCGLDNPQNTPILREKHMAITRGGTHIEACRTTHQTNRHGFEMKLVVHNSSHILGEDKNESHYADKGSWAV